MTRSYRCIVTSKNSQGKSIVIRDEQVGVGPLGIVDFRRATTVPSSLTEEPSPGPVRLEPPNGGAVFRFFEIPPQDPSLSKAEAERRVAQAFADVVLNIAEWISLATR